MPNTRRRTGRFEPMALIYDFDGTLAPGNMQEHQFLPDIGTSPEEFWAETETIAREHQADQILIYMHRMLEKAHEASVSVRRNDFKERGQNIQLFAGVEEWFDRITDYGRTRGLRIEHYLISSGNEEIISGSPIATKFEKIYASKFIFDENGVPAWPGLAINYTTKTQYLFRINKNAHDLSDSQAINQFIEEHERPVPFANMVFIGDGTTDVPCFRLVKDLGGLSIAVYLPRTPGARESAHLYQHHGRVHAIAPADYRDGKRLDEIVKRRIESLAARVTLDRVLTQ